LSPPIEELDAVELTREVGRWPTGTRGTVVMVHNAGEAFEVEIGGTDFSDLPLEDVLLTLYRNDVRKADA
jgi:hypothetical protein